jgi:carbon-monoxide dehydrogenase small subunit
MIKIEGFKEIILDINDRKVSLIVKPSETLLCVLRENLGLQGTKLGCENGDCGACTVLLDGDPVKSCMILAVETEGKMITTIEGLKADNLKELFLKEGGFQCGYCTSGVLMNAYALLKKYPIPSKEQIREWLESNLCRCTGYEGIEKAVEQAARSKSIN